jgi:hypothetical protein
MSAEPAAHVPTGVYIVRLIRGYLIASCSLAYGFAGAKLIMKCDECVCHSIDLTQAV